MGTQALNQGNLGTGVAFAQVRLARENGEEVKTCVPIGEVFSESLEKQRKETAKGPTRQQEGPWGQDIWDASCPGCCRKSGRGGAAGDVCTLFGR